MLMGMVIDLNRCTSVDPRSAQWPLAAEPCRIFREMARLQWQREYVQEHDTSGAENWPGMRGETLMPTPVAPFRPLGPPPPVMLEQNHVGGVGLPASDAFLHTSASSSSRTTQGWPGSYPGVGGDEQAKGRPWTPRSGMQALPNSLSWRAWHQEAIREGLNGASRRARETLASSLSEGEIEAKRKELWEGLHLMQSALDEVYLSMLSAPQDPTVASVWSFHMSQLLYDILEGCDYIQRRGQLYAAHSCKAPINPKMNVGAGDYTRLQQELGNRRQQARDLLQAVKRSSKESTSWIAQWLPFAVCCTNR